MTQAPTKNNNYLSHFQAMEGAVGANGHPWVRELRQRGWSSFSQLGFPTARRGNERWKYTNVAPIANATFSYPVNPAPDGEVKLTEVKKGALWQDQWTSLVFLDGYFSATLSTAAGSNGRYAGNLADAPGHHQDAAEQHLGRHARVEDDGFTALNTAFLRDGALLQIPDGYSAPEVVHLIFVTTEQNQPVVTHPRTLVVAGRNTELTVVESYVSLTDGASFTNAVTEMVLADGANVHHYRLLLENTQTFHVGTSRVYQGQDSTFTSASFAKGAALGRNDFQVLLDAPGASCTLNGLYLTTGSQHMDNLINIDHAKPHGTSRLFYKGILDGQSRAVFGGTVMVREDAQKTNAHQTDKNLLLSEDAEVDSKPSLLIYADDVMCGHGATAGHIDQDTLFYMRSRGLDLETASRILVQAFAGEIIDTVELLPLRDYLDRLYSEALPTPVLPSGGA